MAASRADIMVPVASMAACGLRELDDEVDEDRAELRGELGHSKGDTRRLPCVGTKRQVGTRGAHSVTDRTKLVIDSER
jgi:hypothetical protein